jgi:ATP-dependent Clp protease protease subunit
MWQPSVSVWQEALATISLAGGEAKRKRYSLPNSTIHMHPAGGGARGYAPDVEIMARESVALATNHP